MEQMKYDVFISCKSEDYSKVEPIYHWLVKKGHHPFFSPISLSISTIQGEPVVFGDEIDDALEEANNMIVFTSKAEYVKSGYVKDEWRTFVEEQRAGRKSGSLVTILDGINVADLPIRLRSVQSFTPSNFKQGLLRFLGNVYEGNEKIIGVGALQEIENERTFIVDGVSFKMIRVEGGTFWMGAQKTDPNGQNFDSDALFLEKPVHKVTLSSFYMGEVVVTQALWKAVAGSEPTDKGGWENQFGRGDNYPAYRVSYNDIVNDFLPKLNRLTRKNFRLPTEAEWEFAARGGSKSLGYKYAGGNTIGDVAWYWKNSGDNKLSGSYDLDVIKKNNCKTHPVSSKKPNELGLYDMSGNVLEWCQDGTRYFTSSEQTNPNGISIGSDRVLRGGSWVSVAEHCRVSLRYGNDPDLREDDVGFRLVLPQ